MEDEITDYTEAVLDCLQKKFQARVPAIWLLEVSNVLLLAERKKRISAPVAHNFKNILKTLPIFVDNDANARIWIPCMS